MKKLSFIWIFAAGTLSLLPFITGCSSRADPGCVENSAEEGTYTPTETEESSAMESSEQASFEEKVQVAIGSEIGALDYVPIKVFEHGWLCQKDGKAGFLSTDGIWEIAPDYSGALITVSHDRQTGEPEMGYPVCFYDPEDLSSCIHVTPDEITEGNFLGDRGPLAMFYYTNPQRTEILMYSNAGGGGLSPVYDEYFPDEPLTLYAGEDDQKIYGGHSSVYSIFNPSMGKLHGPYSDEDYPAFGITPRLGAVQLYYGFRPNVRPYGPFWEKAANGSYTVYSADGTEMIYGLDFAEPAGFDSMTVRFGDSVSVIDESLQTVFETKGEAAALPIENTVPVKWDGKWILEDISEK